MTTIKWAGVAVALAMGFGAVACGSAGDAGDPSHETGVDSTLLGVNAGPNGLLINAGGPAAGAFIADTNFVGGTTVVHANAINLSGVTNPAPLAVYQSAHAGAVTYTIPGLANNSAQRVRLHFAETYFTAAGSRVFHVFVNGTKVLNNFDIVAAAGAPNKAHIAELNVNASATGQVTIQLQSVTNQGMISGIEVTPVGCGGSLPGVAGHPNPALTYPTYPGFSLALAEEFDCPLDLDQDPIWTWSDGAAIDGQVRFQKSGLSFANGKLQITVRNQVAPASNSYADALLSQNPAAVAQKPLTSGQLRTKHNNYRYGRYELRVKAPIVNPDPTKIGNFLAMSYVFRTPRWQEWNEIDSELTADRPTQVQGNVVNALNSVSYPGGNAAPWALGTGLPANYKITDTHDYAFEWTPTAITWFVDGVQVRQFAGSPNVPVPVKSAKIMLDLWVFANAAAFGNPANNVYPFTSEYEYFRFYKWNQEAMYPCSPAPSCLPAADTDFSRNNPNEVN